jgi:hypothetical protein
VANFTFAGRSKIHGNFFGAAMHTPRPDGVIRVAVSRERASIRFRNALKADSESAH